MQNNIISRGGHTDAGCSKKKLQKKNTHMEVFTFSKYFNRLNDSHTVSYAKPESD